MKVQSKRITPHIASRDMHERGTGMFVMLFLSASSKFGGVAKFCTCLYRAGISDSASERDTLA